VKGKLRTESKLLLLLSLPDQLLNLCLRLSRDLLDLFALGLGENWDFRGGGGGGGGGIKKRSFPSSSDTKLADTMRTSKLTLSFRADLTDSLAAWTASPALSPSAERTAASTLSSAASTAAATLSRAASMAFFCCLMREEEEEAEIKKEVDEK
jgi:hypothetical protein